MIRFKSYSLNTVQIWWHVNLSTFIVSHIMYRSNRSFNMPPPGNPLAFDFFENYCSKSPLPGPKYRSNAPHWGPFRWSNAPTPGTFQRHKNDRRTAEPPSVVKQNLYKYNKNWETLLAYLLRTKFSCKAAEIAATRSLNAQLFFVCHATYRKRSIKKIPTYYWHHDHFTDMHHRSPLYTCVRSK